MRLISFLLGIKIKKLIEGYKNVFTILVHLLLLFSCVSYAILFSIGIDYLEKLEKVSSIRACFIFSDYFFIVTPIILLFVPSYSAKVNIFQKTDPIKYTKRSLIEITNHILSPVFLLFVLIILFTFLFSPFVSLAQAICWFGLYILSNVICLIIQTLIHLRNFRLLSIFLISAGILFSLTVTLYQNPLLINLAVIFAIVLTGIFYHFVQYIEERKTDDNFSISDNKDNSFFSLLTIIYFRTVTIRINLVIAATFKIVMLFIICVKPIPEGLPILKIFFLLLSSSLIFFTYIHNNIWGYMKNTYEMIVLQGKIGLLFKAYLWLLLIPITVDIACTGTVFWYYGRNLLPDFLSFVLFYVVTILANILVGFSSSVNDAFEIKKSIDFTSFRSNASLSYNFLSVLICCTISYLFLKVPVMYFAPLLIIASTRILFYLSSSKKRIPVILQES